MLGLEKISLKSSNISSSDNLKFEEHKGSVFYKDLKTWMINAANGFFSFTYQLKDRKDIVLNLILRSTSNKDIVHCPISISVNGNIIEQGFDPKEKKFYAHSWRIPQDRIRTGGNTIKISLDKDATSAVLFKEIAIGNFEIENQQQSNWCWCAVAASVVKYYKRNSFWSQCQIYNSVKDTKKACSYTFNDSNIASIDNQGGSPGSFLKEEEIFGGFTNGHISGNELNKQMNLARPVICGIRWKTPANINVQGHAVVISSSFIAQDGKQWVVIDDPYGAKRKTMPLAAFKQGYQSPGDGWEQSWTTKPFTS